MCFSPKQFELYKDEFHTCVVIDVLRATSAICAGLANGVDKIIPVPTVEQACELQQQGCIAAAERNGQIVEGFDFGNSPWSYLTDALVGKTVALTTTNGTKAVAIAKDMPRGHRQHQQPRRHLDQARSNLDTCCCCAPVEGQIQPRGHHLCRCHRRPLIDIARFKSIEDSTIAAKHLFLGVRGNIFSF